MRISISENYIWVCPFPVESGAVYLLLSSYYIGEVYRAVSLLGKELFRVTITNDVPSPSERVLETPIKFFDEMRQKDETRA